LLGSRLNAAPAITDNEYLKSAVQMFGRAR
jgi:hypothetical protein